MLNPVAATAIVEQVEHFCGSTRWHYRLEDDEGATVYRGEPRVLKTEAIKDRDDMNRRANDWWRRFQNGYADTSGADVKILRVALRAVYDTRDKGKAPGR
jgi:hypothetical protein